MNLPPSHRTASVAAALALLLGATACAPVATPPPSASAAPDAHGIDDGGAAEVPAPATALVIADRRGGVTLLDLDTEERSELTRGRHDVSGVFGDGRLVYRALDEEGAISVEVIDTARWTVPHGDHTHSFLGRPRVLGVLDGEGDVRVAGGGRLTSVSFEGGEVVVIAHDELASALTDAPRVTAAATGPVVPFAGHLLIPTGGETIEVLDVAGDSSTGDSSAGAGAACAEASDADVTRVGVVFTCGEGAVLFTRDVGGVIAVETVPHPEGATPAMLLSGRPDRPDLAGTAGDRGAWLLDVRQRQWMLLPSDVPLLRASALGDDDSRTVAIDAEGRVRVLAADGVVLVRSEPVLAASVADSALRDRVQLIIDARHAYVTDPATGAVHEIDLADGRVTRTFAELDPWFVQQVG
ncbi:hypothetical protein [Microbacterium sp. MYb62]|uniref:hypothetical protein n=1 Tax=Microbacterium sp. MYb62 TaxID=1848690 RepID=UPI000CFD7583|nr:hypothetical protein [Microbacterium sp. MYb62]PRB14819.1 hypothetical protein CQ042_10460 [Microbacterium sp. MYb62]